MASASSEAALNDTPVGQNTKQRGLKLNVTQSQGSDLITVEAEPASPQVPPAPRHTRKRKRRVPAGEGNFSSSDSDWGAVTPAAKRRKVARQLAVDEKLQSAEKQTQAARRTDAADGRREQVSQSDFAHLFTRMHTQPFQSICLRAHCGRIKRGELTRLPCCVRFLFGATARGKGVYR